jgi:hypothetical protein
VVAQLVAVGRGRQLAGTATVEMSEDELLRPIDVNWDADRPA